jgi:hypothetical protein
VPISVRRASGGRARAALRRFGLEGSSNAGRASSRAASSGAPRSRAIAAPRLLIADEPTAHVDAQTAAGIADLFSALRSEGWRSCSRPRRPARGAPTDSPSSSGARGRRRRPAAAGPSA